MSTQHDKDIINAIINPLMPLTECVLDEQIPKELHDEEEETEEILNSRALEKLGVDAASAGDMELAMKYFDDSIKCAPRRASPYNNRAQGLRLNGDTIAAMVDLNNAINISEGKGRSACQAYCQRACIRIKQKEDELARADLEKAAALGSEFAKHQLVQMNPYAAMCNKMLREAMEKLSVGQPVSTVKT